MIRIILLCLGILALLMLLSARIQSNTVWWNKKREQTKQNNQTEINKQNLLTRNTGKTGRISQEQYLLQKNEIALAQLKTKWDNEMNKLKNQHDTKSETEPKANDNWSDCKKCIMKTYEVKDWSNFNNLPDIKSKCTSECKTSETVNKVHSSTKKVDNDILKTTTRRVGGRDDKCWYNFYSSCEGEKKKKKDEGFFHWVRETL
jgi:hypothetical protein